MSRGAFYTTLDRLERKGYVVWTEDEPADGRTPGPVRRFEVTDEGLEALRQSRAALERLWRGLDGLLGEQA